ncbi:MAG: glycine oxidase ThiO [Pseudomonadota bacterium]|nr:glycine oxidase ThiO [Pseudomonadota bacterium]
MERDRAVIVGGGLLGCAVALEIARRGMPVEVLERAIVGAEASSAAAGILAPRMEAHGREPLRSIGVESLALYPEWVAGLGADVGLTRTGLLKVVRPGDAPDAPDVEARWLDADAVRFVEPGLAPDVLGAWLLENEATLDPRKLVPAVHAAAQAAGARFRVGEEVASADPGGVTLVNGERVEGRVVVCAGAWTAKVPGLRPLPVRPVRGQLVALSGERIRHVLFGAGGYLVPRADGRVIAGATVEEVGFSRGVTAGGVRAVLQTAVSMVPDLASANFEGAWSGFRPGTPDNLPVLGDVGGIWVASGHYRNGILLAPLTAKWMAAAVVDGARLPPVFSPARF